MSKSTTPDPSVVQFRRDFQALVRSRVRDAIQVVLEEELTEALGCESYYYDDMPAAFIEKGASAYVGWSTMVSLEHVDKAALDLLDNLCAANMTLREGISRTTADLGKDPNFGAYLKFYPPGSGSLTVRQLIQGMGKGTE